jgi:hypothetical protein
MYYAVLAPASARAAVSLSRAPIVAGAARVGFTALAAATNFQRGTISDRHGVKPLITSATAVVSPRIRVHR